MTFQKALRIREETNPSEVEQCRSKERYLPIDHRRDATMVEQNVGKLEVTVHNSDARIGDTGAQSLAEFRGPPDRHRVERRTIEQMVQPLHFFRKRRWITAPG